LRSSAISVKFEIGHSEGRGIVHSGEHHAVTSRVELQVQAADRAAVEAPGLGRILMVLNPDAAGRTAPRHSNLRIGSTEDRLHNFTAGSVLADVLPP
jgi:hypothetical protein